MMETRGVREEGKERRERDERRERRGDVWFLDSQKGFRAEHRGVKAALLCVGLQRAT